MKTLVLVILASLAAPAAAARGPAWQTAITWGWRAQIPAGWKLIARKKPDPRAPFAGIWVYASPKRNFHLRVRITNSVGPFKAVAKASFVRLVRRDPKLKLSRSKVLTVAGRQIWYLLASAKRVRKRKNHDFLLYRLLLRAAKRKLDVSVELDGADERLPAFEAIVDRFTDSFALVEPKSAVAAFKKTQPRTLPKKGGKR